jgi:hypothetical protein
VADPRLIVGISLNMAWKMFDGAVSQHRRLEESLNQCKADEYAALSPIGQRGPIAAAMPVVSRCG